MYGTRTPIKCKSSSKNFRLKEKRKTVSDDYICVSEKWLIKNYGDQSYRCNGKKRSTTEIKSSLPTANVCSLHRFTINDLLNSVRTNLDECTHLKAAFTVFAT